MKTLLRVLFLAGTIGRSEVNTGTVVVIGYSDEKVVVAADSRQNDGNGAYSDKGYKITVLKDDMVFFVLGMANSTGRWDAASEARQALRTTLGATTDLGGSFLNRVAAQWGITIAGRINDSILPKELSTLPDNAVILNGVFIGLDELGNLRISREAVRLVRTNGNGKATPDVVKVVNRPVATKFSALGEGAIVDEFNGLATSRSKQWAQDLDIYLLSKDKVDRDSRHRNLAG